MTRFIALLRGVNVGGVTIPSAELRECVEGLGFSNVRTVLASGNVVFEASEIQATDASNAATLSELTSRVERALGERFGYEAWIVLTTTEHVRAVIDAFPFDAADESRQPWVVFGSAPEVLDELLAADGLDPAVDPIARGDGVVYWNPVKGTTTDTPFAKLLAKARFKPTTTNRNLRTLQKLL